MTSRPGAHSARAALALAHLTEADPALGALALWCRHRDGDGPTRTDGDTIHYGAEFALRPLPEQVGLAAHHVLHVALRHSARAAEMAARFGDGFAPDLYNLAADGLVNDTLIAAGHPVPRPAVRASEMLSEIDGAPVSASDALAEWDADRLYLHLAARAPNRPGRGGDARRYAKARGFADDLSVQGGDPASREDAEGGAEWQGRVLGAMAAGRAAGTGIGTLAGAMADLPQPRVPWELRLRRLLAQAVSEVPRLSYRRPAGWWCAASDAARRAGRAEPVFAPGRLRDGLRPRLAVGLDTSASVDSARLKLFAAETSGIARRSGAEVRVLGFDTEVHMDRTLGPDGWAPWADALVPRQGGGTDFAPMLAAAATGRPALIVVLTDLDGPTGPDPGVPVLWAVPSAPPGPPAFGTVLDLSR